MSGHSTTKRTTPAGTLNGWDRFWFSPGPVATVVRIRSALAVIAFLYFASYWTEIGFWFADDGVLSRDVFARIVTATESGSESRWRFSPLFLTDSVFVMRAYLLIGMGLALAVGFGRGGRWTAVGLWAVFLGLANRATAIAGLVELPLAFGLGYAAIAPNVGSWKRSHDWTAGLSMRLLQTHTSLWVLTVLLTQLAGVAWWNGTAAFGLAAPTSERLFDLTGLLDSPTIGGSLTHLLVLLPLIGLPLAWIPSSNKYGVWMLMSWWLLLGFLSAELMYAATMVTLVASLRSISEMVQSQEG